ncbi:MAG: protein kinase [Variovorax sp.]|nr:protein kinase [Variovorax sp.]
MNFNDPAAPNSAAEPRGALGDIFQSLPGVDNPPSEQVEEALHASLERLDGATGPADAPDRPPELEPEEVAQGQALGPTFTAPTAGMVVTSELTQNTYTIGSVIGEGAFGVVFEASDVWRNQLAVKVLKPQGKTYEQVQAEASSEFGKLLTLRHPNVTHVLDAFEYRNAFYIVQERCFAPLSNLFSVENLNGFLWLMPIARCLLQAVHFLHVYDWVHQDIHFGNVFMSFHRNEMGADGTPSNSMTFKLGDLGLTKLRADIDGKNTMLNNSMWPPEFYDPDQFGQLGPQVDIYHCGLLFLQLLHGAPIFFTREEILAGVPRQRAEALPAPYNLALSKALRRRVALRTQTAMELWRDLNASPAPIGPLIGLAQGPAQAPRS